MMSEASFASLGPTLLARKGGAKPAMRPQLTPLPEDNSGLAALAEEQLEDLGWNDMGADSEADRTDTLVLSTKPSSKSALLQEPTCSANALNDAAAPQALNANAGADVVPLMARPSSRTPTTGHAHRPANEDTAEDAAPRAEAPLPISTKRARKDIKPSKPRASKGGRRAAFTLRLDPDRHLKLRLAATMQGVSAQALVTQALDAMFGELDALDTLVERMKRT